MSARRLGIATMIVLAAAAFGLRIAEWFEERSALKRMFDAIEEKKDEWVS